MPASPTSATSRPERGPRDQDSGSPRTISSPVAISDGSKAKPKAPVVVGNDRIHSNPLSGASNAPTKPANGAERVPSQNTSPAESLEELYPPSRQFRPPQSRTTGSTSSGSLLETYGATGRRRDAGDELKQTGSNSSKSSSMSRLGTEHNILKKKDKKDGSRQDASPFLGSSPSFRRRPPQLRPGHRNGNGSNTNLRTAPLELDRNYRQMMNSEIQDRSSDRAVDSEDEVLAAEKQTSEDGFLKKMGRHINKGRDAFITNWKSARSGSAHERTGHPGLPQGPPNYKVIRLPLEPQTRITRIRHTMDAAKDKTEYWMPALAYRSIDYLNHNGIDQEGLYRIPGSVTEVKRLESIFDRGPTYDIDLLGPDIEINDVNIVGSMLKTWLRELPDELLPQETQKRIYAADPKATECPQIMRDELSSLPPWKYYLLFAITCHISLVHEHSAKNKMDYKALLVCWQGSIKIDGFCFSFLVCDWRRCWQGCWTEKDALLEEVPADTPVNVSDVSLARRQNQDIDVRSEPDELQEKAAARRAPPTSSANPDQPGKDLGGHSPATSRPKRRSGRRPVSIATTSPQLDLGDWGDREPAIAESGKKEMARPFTSTAEA